MAKVRYDVSGVPYLLPQHSERFTDAGITDSIIRERGIKSIESDEDRMRLLSWSRFHPGQITVPGLLVPLGSLGSRIATTYQFRHDTPRVDKDGKTIKYDTPRGAVLVLDANPLRRLAVLDQAQTLFWTEGIIKADALAARGVPAIGMVGPWGWSRNKQPRPELDEIPLEGRAVVLALDSDTKDKCSVHMGFRRLAEELRARGARVEARIMPPGPNGAKNGVDDWLGPDGTIEDLMALPLYDLDAINERDPEYRVALRRERINATAGEQVRIERAAATIPDVSGEDWDAMLTRPSPRELVKGTGINEGGVITFFGQTGSFKSATVQDLSWHLSSIGSWQGRNRTGGPLAVFYFALEGAGGIGSRAEAWRQFWGEDYPTPRWHMEDALGDLAHPEYRKRLVDRLTETETELAVIDTYGIAIAAFNGGTGDENRDANGFVAKLREIATSVSERTGRALTWILIHHEGWEAGRPRGASALPQACDLVLHFKKDDHKENVAYVRVFKPSRDLAHLFKPWTIRATGSIRWGEQPEEASFAITIDDTPPPEDKKTKTQEGAENREDVYRALSNKWQTAATVEAKTGLAKSTVNTHLTKLAEAKRAQRMPLDKEKNRPFDLWKRR